jgi:hypothetical protein
LPCEESLTSTFKGKSKHRVSRFSVMMTKARFSLRVCNALGAALCRSGDILFRYLRTCISGRFMQNALEQLTRKKIDVYMYSSSIFIYIHHAWTYHLTSQINVFPPTSSLRPPNLPQPRKTTCTKKHNRNEPLPRYPIHPIPLFS